MMIGPLAEGTRRRVIAINNSGRVPSMCRLHAPTEGSASLRRAATRRSGASLCFGRRSVSPGSIICGVHRHHFNARNARSTA